MENNRGKSLFTFILLFTVMLLMAFTVSRASGAGPGDHYLVGTGICDITGPAAEATMGGYAITEQKTSGIHPSMGPCIYRWR